MQIENTIKITIETPAIGDVVMEILHSEIDDNIIEIPNRMFYGIDYTKLDLTYVIEHDIEHFNKLNSINDKYHQVYIDTLCLYGIKISGNYIRLQYWFHQDNDTNSHRMCDGQLTHCNIKGSFITNEIFKVFPQCYSSDVAVYW